MLKKWMFLGLLVVSICASARAELRVVSQWHLGEDDGDAAAGSAVKSTKDSARDKRDLVAIDDPTYSDLVSDKAPASKKSITFNGKSQFLQRTGLPVLRDNFVAEAFAKARSEEGFRVVIQYGSAAHGWTVVRNGKGYQLLLGGVALVGWSGDTKKDEWVHVAIVRENGVTKFFFNGQQAGDSSAQPNTADANAIFSVGGNNEKKDIFEGEIDEIRVSTFAPGGFNPSMLMVNDPEGTNASKKAEVKPETPGAKANGIESASIIFDANPIESNMQFNRGSLVPQTIATDRGEVQCWLAQQNSAPEVPWARSIFINFTDPKLREGRSPVVDIEVEFRQPFDCPIELRADTEKGSRVVGGSWGRDPNWKKFVAHIDDGYFGARQFGNKVSDMHTDGYDLRINSFGADFAIRSIKVISYSLDGKPDYKRLVRFDGLQTAGDLLLFAPGSKNTVDYKFTNLASNVAELKFRHEVIDRTGKVIAEKSGKADLASRESTPVTIEYDTAGLANGVYQTHLQLLSPTNEVVFERRGGFAVAENSAVARAKPGEFLYGLDLILGPAYNSPRLLRWAQFMGADIVRHGFGWTDDFDEITKNLPIYEAAGLQVMLMSDPPKTQDQNERQQQLAKKVDFLKAIAAKLPQIKFYELGNEPDLTFFYPGPIEHYAEDFQIMSKAITSANPSAVVLNGGLCFAGADATTRAKRFIEIIDPTTIGAWSYHGHGPGAGAESSALDRIRDLVRAADKLKPFADTESGVAAQTPAQELVQARTVVQKMVYAQSEKLPFLMFFRLLMFEEAYGMLYSEQEPRPSVVSYANLVRTLRGQQFESVLGDLPGGMSGYVFAGENKSSGSAVFWSDASAAQQVQLKLSPAPGTIQKIDLYGNVTEITPSKDGAFLVEASVDPIYLKWSGGSSLAVVPGAIVTGGDAVVRRSGSDSIAVTIASPAGQPVKGTLRVSAGKAANVTLNTAEFPVNVAAGASQIVNVPVTVNSGEEASVDWPKQWAVFVGVDENKVDLAKLNKIPASLPSKSGSAISSQNVILQNDRIDFERIGGKLQEKACAIVFANVRSDKDQQIKVGASADWWMEWRVNGAVAYSTLDRGNGGGYSVSDHTFTLSLKKGDNLIAIKQLSGSMGWKLLIGSPSRLAEASSEPSASGIKLELVQDGKPTETRTLSLRRAAEMGKWTAAGEWAALDSFDSTQPDFVLLDHVTNNFAKLPDATKWWQGPKDLSARGWARTRGDKLLVLLAVEDEKHASASSGKVEEGDAVRLRLLTKSGKAVNVDITGKKSAATVTASDASMAVKGNFTRTGNVSFYQVEISPSVGDRPEYLDAIAFDADDVPAKQHVSLIAESAKAFDGAFRLIWPGK